jgi:uncharacterized protein
MPAPRGTVHLSAERSHAARGGAQARHRGPVRRFAETRGLVGGFTRHHLDVRLLAADGTHLAASFLPGPAGAPCGVVLAHGFAANRRKPAYARLAEALAARFDVLTVDLRGHGGSGGASTLGDAEHLDVAAGAEWLRRQQVDRVVLVGASMGGTAVLHAAARARVPPVAVVTVSAPAWFRAVPPPGPLEALDRLWRSPVRRAALRAALGVRLAGPQRWSGPLQPVEFAGAMGVPLLAIHGEDDLYFPREDASALVAASSAGSLAWLRPNGFGHAEDGFTADFGRELAAAIARVAESGRFTAPAGHP